MARVTAGLGAIALALAGCGGDGANSTGATPVPSSTTTASFDDGGERCVAVFSLEGLAERAFAFDGTVTEVMTEVDPKLADDGSGLGPQPRARFDVSEWFAGGSEPSVLIWLQRDVSVGDRLLVSGQPRWGGEPLDDAIQWECGWTTVYTAADADSWRDALVP